MSEARKEKAPGARHEVGIEEEFPPCIVEEIPFTEDLTTMEFTRVATKREDCKPTPALVDYIPGCIVEEIPWPGNDNCSCHTASTKVAEDAVEQRLLDAGSGAAVDEGGSVHGSLIRDEHLALIFDLNGHLADLEYWALCMGQRMEMLLDAFSNAQSKRKCPLCSQAYTILVGTTRQMGEEDRSPDPKVFLFS